MKELQARADGISPLADSPNCKPREALSRKLTRRVGHIYVYTRSSRPIPKPFPNRTCRLKAEYRLFIVRTDSDLLTDACEPNTTCTRLSNVKPELCGRPSAQRILLKRETHLTPCVRISVRHGIKLGEGLGRVRLVLSLPECPGRGVGRGGRGGQPEGIEILTAESEEEFDFLGC